MKDMYIMLTTIVDVRDFVNAVNTINGDVDLVSGRYTVDGKSIMGIFSLDLMSPIKVIVSEENYDELAEKIGRFTVEQ